MDSFLSIHPLILGVFYEGETYLCHILLQLQKCYGEHRKVSKCFEAIRNRLTLLFSFSVASIKQIMRDIFRWLQFIFEYHLREVIHQFNLDLILHFT